MTQADDGHDEGQDIGMDAVPAAPDATVSYPSQPVVVDSTTDQEGQDANVGGPQPGRASPLRRHRRLALLIATGFVVIGIAAAVAAIQEPPTRPPSATRCTPRHSTNEISTLPSMPALIPTLRFPLPIS